MSGRRGARPSAHAPWYREVSLETRTTLRLPAVAEHFCVGPDDATLLAALERARALGLPVHVLGEGSNVVLGERVEGLVIVPGDRTVRWEPAGERVRVTAGAGVDWHALVMASARLGFWGIETLALIPGSVGAAPVQNVGAYGRELAETFVELEAVDVARGETVRMDREACAFGYRDSLFRRVPESRWLITRVTLELDRAGTPRLDYPGVRESLGDAAPTPLEIARAITRLRRRRLPDPRHEPNAGSFFKNPVVDAPTLERLLERWPELPHRPAEPDGIKLSAAWMIEQCGWKGRQAGAVGVSARHALVLVHRGGGSARELLALADAIAADVAARFSVALEMEPRVIGAPD